MSGRVARARAARPANFPCLAAPQYEYSAGEYDVIFEYEFLPFTYLGPMEYEYGACHSRGCRLDPLCPSTIAPLVSGM